LGVLSGDHLKECSDLGIPVVAVGFLYQEGYFSQRIPSNGWQEAVYKDIDFNSLPLVELLDPSTSKPLLIPIFFNEIIVQVRVWLVEVGRTKLYLMDSNVEDNPAWDRNLTSRLYGGNSEMRMKQEMILGFGAVRIFDKLGVSPSMWHLNEGHCSFASLERIRRLVKKGKPFSEAVREVRRRTLFTTHTPVPAGHDVFPFSLIEPYFLTMIKDIGRENFFSLGTYDFGQGLGYNMTVLALRTACRSNAVSRLHQSVSREMFTPLWKELEQRHIENFQPITYITNGIHVPSFVGDQINQLLHMVNEGWQLDHDSIDTWNSILDTLTDNDIWEFHKTAKGNLIHFMRETARNKLRTGEWDSSMALVNGALLDPEILTIGFARRFATYKRANLVFFDLERLKRIVNDPYRPVQIIFAGKSHPADDLGKRIIQEVVQQARNPGFGNRIAFLENYDLSTAKRLVQGVDLWLNNPIRPHEASGTSGMKAAINFIPQVSILDGWWAEGLDPKMRNGWAINSEAIAGPNPEGQNRIDANSLYDLLEKEIVPTYYNTSPKDAIPHEWVQIMRNALVIGMCNFSSRRMLKEYSEKLYAIILRENGNS
ncbi:MAG TPA: alpha-glucan family phosphorylase, partial [Candidatus Hodarchaeales archaeon]|nr:alpha-glucan family phosphorylase [Candidatus Hodarchaeales archaeon]